MRVLVTGAEGFIGRRVMQELEGRWPGVETLGLSSEDDILADSTLDVCAVFEPDTIIHLAAMHFVPWCRSNPDETLLNNTVGTHRVLRWFPRVNNIVIASSAAVYGLSAEPGWQFGERRDDPRPIDVYGESKAMAELALEARSRTRAGRYVAARLFNVVGPDDPVPHLVPTILAARGKTAKLDAPALKWARDFVYVDDAARSLVDLAAVAPAGFNTVNVCTGAATTGWDLVKRYDVQVEDNPDARRTGGGHLVGDPGLLRSMTGRVPQDTFSRLP